MSSKYEQRHMQQLELWAGGNSQHNHVDDECCPDFSCCNKKMHTPDEERKKYLQMYRENADSVTPFHAKVLGEAMAKSGHQAVIIGGEGTDLAKCEYCAGEFEMADLRPYGRGGVLICHPCGMKPENKDTTEEMLARRFRGL